MEDKIYYDSFLKNFFYFGAIDASMKSKDCPKILLFAGSVKLAPSLAFLSRQEVYHYREPTLPFWLYQNKKKNWLLWGNVINMDAIYLLSSA